MNMLKGNTFFAFYWESKTKKSDFIYCLKKIKKHKTEEKRRMEEERPIIGQRMKKNISELAKSD
jgi:hypothetical protein